MTDGTVAAVIIPDVILLLHAYDSESPLHTRARSWWEHALSPPLPVGLAWVTMLGFIRIATHPRVMTHPMPVGEACGHAEAWLGQPQVVPLHPGDRHAATLFGLLRALGSAGNLTTDAHLAALAIEHQAELNSTDADFARFPGLRFRNPITE